MNAHDFIKYHKFFNENEFDSPDEKDSGLHMNSIFMNMLYDARKLAGIPFKITSGYRTGPYNKKVGGVDGSSHMFGIACDIVADISVKRYKTLSSLLQAGFTRIGIGKNFIHCDLDKNKAQNVIWHYYK